MIQDKHTAIDQYDQKIVMLQEQNDELRYELRRIEEDKTKNEQ
jgi:hypothetical protein